MRPRLTLIVNADDFGLSAAVNEGIRDAHLQGILTSASLMANGGAFEHAVAVSRAVPTLDVGVHLTLVEERPLLPPELVPSLVDHQGRFPGHATSFLRKYLRGGIALDDVRRELEAQVDRVLETGIPVSHLDSHQHVHLIPGVRAITADLARRWGIQWVRSPRERVCAYMLRDVRAWGRLAQLLGLRGLDRLSGNHGPAGAGLFAGFFYGGRLGTSQLERLLRHLPRDGTCELMCHPGRADPATPYAHWRYHWEEELRALTDPGIRGMLERSGTQLTSFRDLAAATARMP